MAIRVLFEVGHTSKLKSKQTPDGFTHDWELYVRGTEKNDISHFVDKVVFNLHESFPKPKRVLKEAPYVLKESGYAGFMVPTEIHFKNRDQPKVMMFTYDLSLQNAGPPVHRSEIKKFTFNNPSEDFRRKLVKGGGVLLVSNTNDDKSRDSMDDRSQSSKQKMSSDEVAKKHKIRPEESKSQTFAKLFGPPITKTTSKVSPDAKNKSSPSTASTGPTGKSGKAAEKEKGPAAMPFTAKDKSEKAEKKEKHKHSPHKDKYESKDSKKTDDKHERREEKKKDKSHSKERDRSHDKGSKRPPSPKRAPSPKKPSPARSSSSTGRGDTNGYKTPAKTHPEPVALNNNADKVSGNSSSGGKKSKKEKKAYDKDRDRDKSKDKDRDRKDKALDDRSSNNSTPVAPPVANHTTAPQTAASTKLPGGDAKSSLDYVKNKEKDAVNPGSSKDTAKESNKKISGDVSSNVSDTKKSSEKHDKDSEKRHKHKKKDKNKEKEKEKDHSGSKDSKKKDKSAKKDDFKKTPKAPQSANEVAPVASQKSNNTPLSKLLHAISDDDTQDSVAESLSATVSERHESFAESSNSSVTDIASKAAANTVAHQPPPPLPPPASTSEELKPDKKDRRSRDKEKVEKDEKKRKRKSKDDVDASHKATPPPNLIPEPPLKQPKKDELIVKNGDRSNSPHLSHLNSNSSVASNPSPKGQQSTVDDSKAFRTPNAANVPLPSTSSSCATNSNNLPPSVNAPDRAFTVDYISELRDLQQKIMTLQDSNDLQQVVELIAPTGRFEITSKSFDFDLCTLDRNTVQKLQDFFATSCS